MKQATERFHDVLFFNFQYQTLPTIPTYTYNTDIAFNNNTCNTASTYNIT